VIADRRRSRRLRDSVGIICAAAYRRARMARPKLKQPWAARKKARSTTREEFVDDGEGTFAQLFERHPDLARRETRTITFQKEENEIPPGEYAFAEAFCMGRTCDCRRVMFMVYLSN
jgi:hypothetical protein